MTFNVLLHSTVYFEGSHNVGTWQNQQVQTKLLTEIIFIFIFIPKDHSGNSFVSGTFDVADVDNYVNYNLENDTEVRSLALNHLYSEQRIDLIKPFEEWLDTNTLRPMNDKSTDLNTTCGVFNNITNSDTVTCYHENVTCVGEPEYCNLTEMEYLQMLYDYIFPTPGEWVLIGFHTAVFLVGLVRPMFPFTNC